jgi:hypothetical protein
MYPFVHSLSFNIALRLALRSVYALVVLTLPPFNADLLSAAPLTLMRLTPFFP